MTEEMSMSAKSELAEARATADRCRRLESELRQHHGVRDLLLGRISGAAEKCGVATGDALEELEILGKLAADSMKNEQLAQDAWFKALNLQKELEQCMAERDRLRERVEDLCRPGWILRPLLREMRRWRP